MTPQGKAKELVDRFHVISPQISIRTKEKVYNKAKQCALIAVDEIIKNDSVGMSSDFNHLICDTDYWQQVKKEIENL
jgi:hypothetical protein